MQTVQIPTALTGAVQTPLLSGDQIVVGAIITGTGWQTVREVVDVRGDIIHLDKLPAPPRAAGHVHAFSMHSNTECACGRRCEPVAGLLPSRPGVCRTYILVPTGPLVVPDKLTVYLTNSGREIVVGADGTWSQSNMPVVPRLHAAWALPQELRALLEG